MAGRKEKWEQIKEQLPTITKMTREGNSEIEIIEYLKIGKSTFYKYKREYPELQAALDEGYRTSLEKVEAALYKSALGYVYEEITEIKDGDGKLIETKKVKKEVQPNVSAIMNILKNKRTADWNVSEKVDIKGEIASRTFPDLPSAKVSELAKLLLEEDGDPDEDK